MNTDYLHYLLVINDCQSINQAAKLLHLQRPYLSKIVQLVEEQLEVTIFERHSKGVIATSDGLEVLAQAQKIVAATEKLLHFAKPAQNQCYPQYFDELTVFFPTHVRPRNRLPAIASQFQQILPNVSLSLIGKKGFPSLEIVAKDSSALAFVLYSELATKFKKAIPPTVTFLPLIEASLVALASKHNSIANKYRSISLSTLCKQNLVLLDTDQNKNSFICQLLADYAPQNIKFTISNLNMLYTLLENNDYFSIGSYIADYNDGLVQIPLRENIRVQLGLLFQTQAADNFVTRSFINTVLASYKLPSLENSHPH